MHVWKWTTYENGFAISNGIFETKELAIKTMKNENGWRTPRYNKKYDCWDYAENWESTREEIEKVEVFTKLEYFV